MSLSDLELLQLVDTVKAKQRGPKGETGVGISEIDQFDETGFTIRLTDGSFKRINLPAPKDGAVGPVGPAGPVGESGSAGRPGRDGVQGPAGRDGADGLPGSFVETAVVNGNGHLLLGISDGQVIDVGRVVGPAGATGERGATGLPGERGVDGTAVLSGPRAPTQDDGVEGDHWIDISSAEFSFFKKDGDGWTKLANLRQPAIDPRVGPVSGGGGSGSGSAGGYTTSNLPLTGLGRSSEPTAGGINKPGGNIIPKATDLKFQSNMNRWVVNSLDALDDALPIGKVDELPDEGKYDGDMVLFEGALWIYSGDDWIEVGGAVDVSDFALKSSVQRVEDNLDLVQETVGAGKYKRVAKPLTPVGPGEGEACFLQDGGAEATTFAEVENIQLNKVGTGPYANFDSAKKGDYLLLQSAVDGDFGLYVIRNATEFSTFWDFGLEISSGKAVGTVPEIDEGIIVRTSRPTFTVAQDTPPDFSATGQLWFDTAEHQLKVWDDEEQEFVETAGGAEVHVGEDPPADAAVGDLWYCTKLDDLTLYVLAEAPDVWAAASPPVSLEGLEQHTAELEANVQALWKSSVPVESFLPVAEKVESHDRGLDSLSDTTERLDSEKVDKAGDTMTGRLVTDSPIWIHPGGQGANGEHNMLVVNQAGADTGSVARFQQNGVDILKIEHAQTINACGNHITNLADPEHERHAVTRQWAEGQFALKSDIPAPDTTSYLPLSGGKLTGNLSFSNNTRIDCNNGSTVLSGRGCFELRAGADKPIIFSSGSGSKRLLSFYGYDGSQPDNKGEKAYITAGGEAKFKKVYAEGKELATKEYVGTEFDTAVSTSVKGSYQIFNCQETAQSTYATEAIYWTTDNGKIKLVVSCDAMDDFAQIHRDRYRGPDFNKTEWETPLSIMRLSGDLFQDENPILQAKTEHVRVLTYNGNKYFNIWFDPNKALTWRPDAFVGVQEGRYPDSVRSRISISGIWSHR